MLQLAAEDEVVIAEDLLRPCLVKVGEEDLGLRYQLLADEDPTRDRGALRTEDQHLDRVGQLFAGEDLPMKAGRRDLRQDHLLAEVIRLTNQDPAGLGQALQNERAGHDRVAGKVVGEVIFRQAQVLHRPGRLAAVELRESVDPDPSHAGRPSTPLSSLARGATKRGRSLQLPSLRGPSPPRGAGRKNPLTPDPSPPRGEGGKRRVQFWLVSSLPWM